MTTPNKLDRYLDKAAADLPSMPMIASEVSRAAENPDTSLDDIRGIIEQDTGIAARLLKIANSALYGFPSEIQSLGHAISLLGTLTVRNLVLAASLKQTYKRFGLMEKLLWHHSALAGPVAAGLAKHPGVDVESEAAFTAGLMHDIGKVALANSHRDEYEKVVARVYNERISFREAERDEFGFDHAELGACVAERWHLPVELVSVIRHHHDPGQLAELPEVVARLTALVSVTTACLTRLGIGRREPVEELDVATLPAWSFLGLSEDDAEPILQTCRDQVKNSRVMIG